MDNLPKDVIIKALALYAQELENKLCLARFRADELERKLKDQKEAQTDVLPQ
jgi:hypothetical protein